MTVGPAFDYRLEKARRAALSVVEAALDNDGNPRPDGGEDRIPKCVVSLQSPTHFKVYNAIHKVQDELYSTPEDGADFLAKLGAEPGMFVKRTFDDLGRIVNVFWATVDQQEKMIEVRRLCPDGYNRVYEQVRVPPALHDDARDQRGCKGSGSRCPQVPTCSLPQEWLWFESWCLDASKAEAKTIDLCNNPQHKEPKLRHQRSSVRVEHAEVRTA
eukprot:g15994.t1